MTVEEIESLEKRLESAKDICDRIGSVNECIRLLADGSVLSIEFSPDPSKGILNWKSAADGYSREVCCKEEIPNMNDALRNTAIAHLASVKASLNDKLAAL